MRLTQLKVSTEQTDSGFLITVLPGDMQFVSKAGEVTLAEPLQLKMTGEGQFVDILRNVAFEVRGAFETRVMQGSVFSIVTHEDFEPALYRAMRKCKVVPMMRLVDERALYAAEYERLYEQLVH